MKYQVIYADPPWRFTTYSKKGLGRSAEAHYDCMSLTDIKSLPVLDYAAEDCALFLWVTDPLMPQALEVMRAWGFCVGHDMRVLTSDMRWIRSGDVLVGDRLLAFDEECLPDKDRRYYRHATVLSNDVRMLQSYEITLEDGTILISSHDHPWLATIIAPSGSPRRQKWYKTQNLLLNRKAPIGLPLLAPVAEKLETYEAGFLGGAFDSEGSVTLGARSGLRFMQNQNELLTQVKSFLVNNGFSYSIYNSRDCRQLSINGGLKNVMRFMMQCRPPRLLNKWSSWNANGASLYNLDKVKVVSVRPIGEYPCSTIMTDVGTYICEGFGAHNTYKTVAFTWAKQSKDGSKFPIGCGYWTRSNPEMCLLGTRGKPLRLARNVRQLVLSPRREHSRKPDIVRHEIMRLCAGPYLELFSREDAPGWSTAMSNQAGLLNNGHVETRRMPSTLKEAADAGDAA